MSDYVEYYTTRKPTKLGVRAIAYWHKRMLMIAKRFIPDFSEKTILEIGPGHGFFAEVCQQQKLAYRGLEMNVEQANALQLAGHSVLPATIPPIPSGEPVQVIWLSHVLEHASSYVEAKAMLVACYDRLDAGGYVTVIGPDIIHCKEGFWSGDWSHGFPTSLNRVEQLLSETGFALHKSLHHTFTVTNPLGAWSLSMLFRCLLPVTLFDYFFQKLSGRRFGYAFMTLFGWRQIYIIGKKKS